MKKSDVCTKVRDVVDEIIQSRTDGVSLITDQANLDEIIKDKIEHALRWILLNASGDMLSDVCVALDMTAIPAGDVIQAGTAWKVKLPSNTLRVISANLSSWTQTPNPVGDSTPIALMQSDEYARGSADRPVTVLSHSGNRLLIGLYSGLDNETKTSINVTYIEIPDTSADDIDVPVRCEGAFIYYTAALTMTAFRESLASSLFDIANQQLGIQRQEQEG